MPIEERSQVVLEPGSQQRFVGPHRADRVDRDAGPQLAAELFPDVIRHLLPVGRREQVGLAQEDHGRDGRTVEGTHERDVVL